MIEGKKGETKGKKERRKERHACWHMDRKKRIVSC
jgi:hypothetical protein